MAEVGNNNGGALKFENYNVSAGKGSLYQSSKEPKEGFEEIVLDSGKKTYHRYVRGVSGIVTKVDIREANFPSGVVKQLVVNVQDKETNVIQVIQIPLFNTKKNYSQSAVSMMNILPNLDKSKEVVIGYYLSEYEKKNGTGKGTNVTAYASYVGEKTEDGKPVNVKWIDFSKIPQIEVVEKLGEKTYNMDKRDEFYYSLLQEILEKFTFTPTQNSSAEKPAPSFKQEIEDDTDLPF